MISFIVNEKVINIFNEEIVGTKKVPLIIHNSFSDTGIELWEECKRLDCTDFILVNISNVNWNDEMTPWKCKPLYKNDKGYSGKSDEYILELTKIIIPQIEKKLNYKPQYYGLIGYSLGGLFSLYSTYKTDVFKKVASVSGSLWYPDFFNFVKSNKPLINLEKVYLSLGDKEKSTKINLLKNVQANTEKIYEFYKSNGINVTYELNEGGHFKEINLRTAKGIKEII